MNSPPDLIMCAVSMVSWHLQIQTRKFARSGSIGAGSVTSSLNVAVVIARKPANSPYCVVVAS